MRSNDAFIGLPHDVFCFTMLQEIMARTLNTEIGTYSHAVGSLHLYEKSRNGAKQFLNEGWQQIKPMPKMALGDPWKSIEILIQAEKDIRNGKVVDPKTLGLAPYWEDLVRILLIYSLFKTKQHSAISSIKSEMSNKIYNAYIEKRETQ